MQLKSWGGHQRYSGFEAVSHCTSHLCPVPRTTPPMHAPAMVPCCTTQESPTATHSHTPLYQTAILHCILTGIPHLTSATHDSAHLKSWKNKLLPLFQMASGVGAHLQINLLVTIAQELLQTRGDSWKPKLL